MWLNDFVEVNGQQVAYHDLGEGPAVILLHGFCLHSQIFENYINELSREYRVICVDLPGHGESEVVPGISHMEGLAEWLIHVMSVLQVKEAAFIGHSLGGYIALALARLNPRAVTGLCLLHSTPSPDSFERRENRDRALEFIESYGTDDYYRAFVPSLLHFKVQKTMELLYSMCKQTDVAAIFAITEAMRNRYDYRKVIRRLECPVMFIVGLEDKMFNLTDLRRDWVTVPQASVEMYPEVGHMSMYEAPERFMESISSFLIECSEGVFK